jgi:hypothetical protein
VPVVICLIGARVVIEGIYTAQADAAHGPPVEVAEIDDQVGRHAIDGAVQFLRPIRPGAKITPLGVGDGGDALDEVVEVTSADSLVSGSSHKSAKWLAG